MYVHTNAHISEYVIVFFFTFGPHKAPQSFISVRSMIRYDVPGEVQNCHIQAKDKRYKFERWNRQDSVDELFLKLSSVEKKNKFTSLTFQRLL